MSKRLLYALLILTVATIVLIFNRGDISVDLIFTEIKAIKSLVFLSFMGIGVIVGVLMR